MFRIIIFVIIIIAIIYFFKKLSSPTTLFKIVVKKSVPHIQGKVPGYANPIVLDFFESLKLPNSATVVGIPSDNRTPGSKQFQLTFSKHLDDDTCQRIRNFLYLNV